MADDVFKCIFLNENVWILIHTSLTFVLRVQSTLFQHWFRRWLGADQATSHYLNQYWLDYRGMYGSLGLNELSCKQADRSWILLKYLQLLVDIGNYWQHNAYCNIEWNYMEKSVAYDKQCGVWMGLLVSKPHTVCKWYNQWKRWYSVTTKLDINVWR